MRSPLIDKATAERLGKLAICEELIAQLTARLDEQEKEIGDLKRQLSRVLSPSQLLSESQAAEMLGLSTQTLARWRKDTRPVIPFVANAGIIRYRAEDIERFIREGTRGARLRAA
jgi:DNA-binding transcriptional MerR regulator